MMTDDQLPKIDDHLPIVRVNVGCYSVGRMRYAKGEYNKNNYWIEKRNGEGTEIPLPEFEKALQDLFDKHF